MGSALKISSLVNFKIGTKVVLGKWVCLSMSKNCISWDAKVKQVHTDSQELRK